MDIYVIVDGDEEGEEDETVGFAPWCAVTSIGVDWPGRAGMGVDEIVV